MILKWPLNTFFLDDPLSALVWIQLSALIAACHLKGILVKSLSTIYMSPYDDGYLSPPLKSIYFQTHPCTVLRHSLGAHQLHHRTLPSRPLVHVFGLQNRFDGRKCRNHLMFRRWLDDCRHDNGDGISHARVESKRDAPRGMATLIYG